MKIILIYNGFIMKFKNTRLTFVSDSSSLILLAKADLLRMLCFYSDLSITEEIENEIEYESDDSKKIKDLLFTGKITVRKAHHKHHIFSLDAGEISAIMLFKTISSDYLILDDKKAALYCKKHSIPFINALLVPLYLKTIHAIDDQTAISKIELLSNIGRYAPWIKEYVFSRVEVNF